MSGEIAPAAPASLISETPAQAATTGAAPAAPAAPAAAPAPKFSFPDGFDYKSIVPEDIRADPVFAKYKDLDGVFRGVHGAQKLLGKDPSNLIEVPPETDAAARRAVMNRLGASEKAEDYKIEAVKGSPEWLGADQPLGQWLAKTAHENGIPVGTMNKLYGGFVGEMTKAVQAQQAAAVDLADQSIAKLKGELGDDFDGTVRRARTAIEKLGGAPLREALEGADLGVHPVVIKALAQVGALYAEDATAGDKSGGGAELPSEAKQAGMDLVAKSLTTQDPLEKARLQKEAQAKFSQARKGAKI